MKNGLTKVLLLCMVFAMLLCTVVGCSGTGNGTGTGEDTTAGGAQDGTSGEGETNAPGIDVDDGKYDENGYLMDDLPDDLKLESSLDILYWSDCTVTEFEVAFQTGETVSDAVYKRNKRVEERLDVDVNWYGMKGHWSSGDGFLTAVRTSVNGAMNTYDIIAGYSQTTANLAIEGMALSLSDVRYLDLEKPWWPTSLVENFSVGDDLYCITGDISTSLVTQMYVTYFNKNLLANFGVEEDLYEVAEEGNWTLDKLMTLTADMYIDNGKTSGERDEKDTYGIIVPYPYVDCLIYGAGIQTVEKDENGKFVVSDSFVGERAISFADKVIQMLRTNEGGGITGWKQIENNQWRHWPEHFGKGLATFIVAPANEAIYSFTSDSLRYGILPIPKYDTNQKDYYTVGSNHITLYMIAKDCSVTDANAAGAYLECMSSEGYRTITPTVFESCLKTTKAQSPEDAKMYDILREGIVFDFGRVMGTQLKEYTQNYLRGCLDGEKSESWGSLAPTIKTALGELLDSVLNAPFGITD